MSRRRAHFVLSTHWDREWYQTFQDYRFRLVETLGRVFDALEDGRLRGPFQTDGQAIILDDYLEVRPSERPRLERLARERKLVIGPWYVLPDEFLVSGESMVRNLRLGRSIARAFGGRPSDAGFVCDLFGHIGQLPQIFAGFGIRGALVWRGTNLIEHRNLIWEGADGTRLACFRFGLHGYCGFANLVRHANEPRRAINPAAVAADLDEMLRHEANITDVDALLIFDGGDHQAWDEPAYHAAMRHADQMNDDFELIHSSLDDYLAELVEQSPRIATHWRGEMREPATHPETIDNQWLIPGVGSSRVWIKQANAACQTLLCAWAEPFTGLAARALGLDPHGGFLDVAWRWLLQNHPHDSICGCSIDAVHEDMKYRFAQSRQIAERLTVESLRGIASAVEVDVPADALRVCVFNPSGRPFDGVADVLMEVPADWPGFVDHVGFEHKPMFDVTDAGGEPKPHQRLEQTLNRRKTRLRPTKFPEGYLAHDVRLALPLQVPALGYTTLLVRRGNPASPTHPGHQPGMATSEHAMANEHLGVTVESNGTLTLIDKHTGERYAGLLAFEDVADIGDGWYHGPPVNDLGVTSTAAHADVAVLHDGPLVTSLVIRMAMRVPAAFDQARGRRSETWRELPIQSTVTLRRGQDYVEVRTTVDNTCDDHRLRVLLPTDCEARTYLADGAFDVVVRPIALRADRHKHREPELETRPQQTWTAVHEGRRGLAVVSEGLHESAVRDFPRRPIALTLFRATQRTVFTDGEPGGQLRGPMTFRYWIKPLSGTLDRAGMCGLGQRLAAGLRAAQWTNQDVMLRAAARLPATGGFMRVEGDVVLTSVVRVGDAIEVRLFNPGDTTVEAALHFDEGPAEWRPRGATCVDFESQPIPQPSAKLADGVVTITLERKRIVTVRLNFEERDEA